MSAEIALSRTADLINAEFFEGRASTEAVVNGLMASTVRLVADERNCSTRAGQAAIATSFQLIARMGIGIELLVPDTPLVAAISPLRRHTLCSALLDLGSDLIPGATVRDRAARSDAEFVFGSSRAASSDAIEVSCTAFSCSLGHLSPTETAIDAEYPLGGLAAGTATSALALDAALPRIEEATGLRRTKRPRPRLGPPASIELTRLFPGLTSAHPIDIGSIDIVSAGAVSNALIWTLVFLPDLTGRLRVFDADVVELHNINRCTQFRASDVGLAKARILEDSSSKSLTISAVPAMFEGTQIAGEPPLVDRVAVGVDRIEARWTVQQEWPTHLYIAGTSNKEAVLTTHHPGGPCAGCAHPTAAAQLHNIPTISFVSYWAGLLQGCAILEEHAVEAPARRITVFPMGLGEQTWGMTAHLRPNPRCPIPCQASRA